VLVVLGILQSSDVVFVNVVACNLCRSCCMLFLSKLIVVVVSVVVVVSALILLLVLLLSFLLLFFQLRDKLLLLQSQVRKVDQRWGRFTLSASFSYR